MNNNIPGAVIIEGHIQGLSNTRSLGEKGIPVYVVDETKCIAASSIYCKKFFICPDFQSEDFIEFLLNLARDEKLDGWVILPSNDHVVLNISRNKSHLEKIYKVITPDFTIYENIYDKAALLKIAESQKIPIPITQYFTDESDPLVTQLKFPVLTKGRNGLTFYKSLKRKAFLSNDEATLRKQLKMIASKYPLSGTFTQELIPFDGTNKTISFTAFCVNGEIKTYWMGEKLREHPIRFGTATLARSIFIQECLDQSIPLCKSLDYTGVCEVEYLKDPRSGQYVLIEMNARTWLWVGLAKACGVDYAKIVYDFVNRNHINYPLTYEIDIYWKNPITDFIYSLLGILKGRLMMNEYLMTLNKKSIVNALFVNGDMKPGYKYLINLVSIFNKR
jgi:D-aspartate ligase